MVTAGARRRPQNYPDELPERAVRMVLEIREETGERHGAVSRVAKELGIGSESLRSWVNRAEVDSGRRPGTSTADAQRIAQLERQNRELRRANDILKAASVSSQPSSTVVRGGSCVHRRDGESSRSAARWRSPHDLLVCRDPPAVRPGDP